MCDTVIDEHFRRSLGQDYHAIFQNPNPVTETNISAKLPQQVKTPTLITEALLFNDSIVFFRLQQM